MVLNRLRLTVAAVLLALTLLVVRGAVWPTWVSGAPLVILAVSGLIGFVFADTFTFRALVILGAGRGALLSASAPVFTALLAWPILHERLGGRALLGMALTLGGIVWVLREREHREHVDVRGSVAAGAVAGLLGAVGQAVGFVTSKLALRTGVDPLSATTVRIAVAVAGAWALAPLQGQVGRTFAVLRDRPAMGLMMGGALFGPFLGVVLSLTALQLIDSGIAASIIAFAPVLTMLIASRFHRERITLRMMAGTLVAVAGVVVLFLR